ncbi:unnamed protein product [Pleuronectes platessa]|uniref:Uncharacterized protein n=1 Tax=Pleuronectes platessa TaxID=8262 RepID=A0A9N7YV07_PLEPL|nr:unnamed protein product [Pleuronectes platessa]
MSSSPPMEAEESVPERCPLDVVKRGKRKGGSVQVKELGRAGGAHVFGGAICDPGNKILSVGIVCFLSEGFDDPDSLSALRLPECRQEASGVVDVGSPAIYAHP